MRRMFSEKQIQQMIKDQIKVIDEFNIILPDYTGFSKNNYYSKIVIKNGLLHIIGNATYTNTSEETKTIRLSAFDITIPSSIGKYIIDDKGKDLTQDNTRDVIRAATISNTSPSEVNVHCLRLAHHGANKLEIYENETTSVNAGDYITKSFHIILFLN